MGDFESKFTLGKRIFDACPSHLLTLIRFFIEKGERAYPVGGCVRDVMMGRAPHDWDIAVTSSPDKTVEICAELGLKTIPTGIAHGTVTVILPDRSMVEATTCRTDGEYNDSRHPENVTFTGRIEDDLSRRDFTVNAMAADLNNSENTFDIIDLFGGADDMSRGIIRAVGTPEVRFEEDALRILRAVRFASRLDFEIEPDTFRAIQKTRGGLYNVSRERVSSELSQILTSDSADRGVSLLAELGLLPVTLGLDIKNPLQIKENISFVSLEASLPLRLAALILSLDLAADSDRIIRSLKLPCAVSEECRSYLSVEGLEFDVSPVGARRLRREFGDNTLRLLSLAAALGRLPQNQADELSAFVAESEIRGDCVRICDLALSGDDLISIGIPRGRAIGNALNTLLEAVILSPSSNNREELSTIAVKICNYSSNIE